MQSAAKLAKWLGNGWIACATILILLSYIEILYFDGWGKLQEIANPFNLWNFVAIVVALAPGLGLLKVSEYLEQRSRGTSK